MDIHAKFLANYAKALQANLHELNDIVFMDHEIHQPIPVADRRQELSQTVGDRVLESI